ncbi:MAG: histidine phosphatase family protein [Myxococcota bacterium]
MPLRLLLLRHAKAERGDGLADRDRPLAPKGRVGARLVGEWLAARATGGELHVLCSTSLRTRETLAELAIAGALDRARLDVEEGLYLATAASLLERLRRLPEPADGDPGAVLVVAHNPGIHELAVALAGEGDRDAYERLRAGMPTGALAWLECDAAPRALRPGCARLAAFATPRALADERGLPL